MGVILLIVGATILISLISLVGILSLTIKEKLLDKIVIILVALSAGALMGSAFLHLMPESIERFNEKNVFTYVLLGFLLFFLLEKLIHWRHCHKGICKVHTFAYMNLIGDGIHNFIDGIIIAASFVVNINLGITTTLAVALHEIPQEIGDFGVLVYGGFKKLKAVLLNFIIGLTSILGGLSGYLLSSYVESSTILLLPFTAGGFIYIAASDLIPEIRKERDLKKSLTTFLMFLLGILIMLAIK
jgi:zinc and cadmium transporter